ncbi:MAG: acyltransferase [Coriobacteriales bacterium]|nr:acyltransferase [Coriobacteriales bacterium]
MKQKRINYNMKLFTAIAMVLVVSNHLDGGRVGISGPYNLFPPYSFHVAAFVFVAGYFYKPASEDALGRYIARKAWRLIVPLFLISLVYGYVWALAQMALGVPNVQLPTMENLLVDPLINSHQYRFTNAMWFLASLFCAETCNVLVRKAASRIPWPSTTMYEAVLFAAYLLLGSVSIVVGGTSGLEPGWLLLACRSLFFVACFGMGRFYAAVLEPYDTLRSTWYFAIVLFAQLALAVAFRGKYTYTSVWCKYPHGIVGTYAVTILGIAFLLRVCKLLGPVVGRSRVVLAIANNTFSIMCHHLCGFFVLNSIFYMVNMLTGQLGAFDYDGYVNSYKYVLVPRGATQFVLVYVVFGIVFSLLVHAAWKRTKAAARPAVERLLVGGHGKAGSSGALLQ